MIKRIPYKEIVKHKFKEEPSHDSVYYNEYGFEYVVITKQLTKRIFIDWAKETGKATLIRDNKNGDVQAIIPIRDKEHLDEIISFFTKKTYVTPTLEEVMNRNTLVA